MNKQIIVKDAVQHAVRAQQLPRASYERNLFTLLSIRARIVAQGVKS